MRTVLLLGIAAGSLLLPAPASSAETSMPFSHARVYLNEGAAFGNDPRPKLDYGAPTASDTRVYTGYPDRIPSEVEYRRGPDYPAPPPDAVYSGTYEAEGRWTGTWDGTYETPDGRRYEGRYEGSVEGRPGAGYPPPPYEDRYHGGYDPHHDADMARRCGHGNAVGGAIAGGLIGGVAGNRIAGRGNRTAGTVIGGGVGAIAGAAIGSEADRKQCESWWASRSQYHGRYYPGGNYPGGTSVYHHGYGYGYGYGWYTPGVVVTTIVTNGAPVVTERVETSTRTYYETVPVRKRHVAKKKWKPKPKPRCVC